MAERERLFSKLEEIPYLEPYPSHANFILAKVKWLQSGIYSVPVHVINLSLVICLQVLQGRDAKALKDGLANQGIMVRHYAKKELSGYIRISVGKPEQTDALMMVLKSL